MGPGRQPGDVPAPDLAWPFGLETARRLRLGRSAGAAPAMVLGRGAQDPVEARLRGDPVSAIGQARHDLAGRQAGKFGQAAGLQDQLPLGLAQAIGGHRTLRGGTAVFLESTFRILPAFKRALMQAQLGTGSGAPGTVGDGRLDQGKDLAARLAAEVMRPLRPCGPRSPPPFFARSSARPLQPAPFPCAQARAPDP